MKKFTAALFVFLALCSVSHAKIEPQLKSKLSELSVSEEISVIVFMKEKPAISALSGTRGDKISTLNRFSERSQRGISEALTRKKQRNKKISFNRFWTFNGLGLTAPKDVIEEIASRDDVEKVALNRTFSLPPRPQETVTIKPSAKILSFSVEDNIALIKADKVWEEGYSGSGIKVGVADTGVLSTHADLTGKVLLEATFDVDTGAKTADSAPDNDGHGTHVAGIVAGGNASGKYIGTAPGSQLLVAKVFNNDVPDPTASYASVSSGVEWLIANGADIVNLSLGDSSETSYVFFRGLVDIWDSDLNTLIVGAIGNEGPGSGTTNSPGNVPKALGVGAVDNSDDIASFSSRGPVSWSSVSYVQPDISAPGVSIRSSYKTGGYAAGSGTSMACPHAAGVAALMLQANPSLETASIRSILKNTAYRKDGISYENNDYGWGRIDALNAVTAAIAGDTIPPTIEAPSYIGNTFREDITILSRITDNYTDQPQARLFYRNDTRVMKSLPMTREAGSSLYRGIIKGTDVISNINYYIQAVDGAGNSSRSPSGAPDDTHTISVDQTAGMTLSGLQTCPNPFAAGKESATFFFELSKAGQVTVRILNTLGQTVKLFSITGNFGTNSFSWDGRLEDGSLAANGVYLYQITAKDVGGSMASARGKMIVLK